MGQNELLFYKDYLSIDKSTLGFSISSKETKHFLNKRYIVTKTCFSEKLRKKKNNNSKKVVYSKIKPQKNKKSLFAVPSGHDIPVFLKFDKILVDFISIYLFLVTLRILISYLPKLFIRELDSKPLILLKQLTEPFLKIFRGLIPPVGGGLDLSLIIGFFLLSILKIILSIPLTIIYDSW